MHCFRKVPVARLEIAGIADPHLRTLLSPGENSGILLQIRQVIGAAAYDSVNLRIYRIHCFTEEPHHVMKTFRIDGIELPGNFNIAGFCSDEMLCQFFCRHGGVILCVKRLYVQWAETAM